MGLQADMSAYSHKSTLKFGSNNQNRRPSIADISVFHETTHLDKVVGQLMIPTNWFQIKQ